ncbi:hypothetical protein VTN77DRAFT_9386 [Rasamsonia byssochlamydoides]|uniref:uncharacterized protein n=1 Tax=Rasamsonia byssochlamydoides TaxID=89139 RepID=UPI0037433ECC
MQKCIEAVLKQRTETSSRRDLDAGSEYGRSPTPNPGRATYQFDCRLRVEHAVERKYGFYRSLIVRLTQLR